MGRYYPKPGDVVRVVNHPDPLSRSSVIGMISCVTGILHVGAERPTPANNKDWDLVEFDPPLVAPSKNHGPWYCLCEKLSLEEEAVWRLSGG